MNIEDIPYVDVLSFLTNNNIPIPADRDKIYDKAFGLFHKNPEFYPDSVIEWLMAYNLLQSNVNIPFYAKDDIYSLNQTELKKLSKLLGMNTTNIDHIIGILKYLHKLSISGLGLTGIAELDEDILKNTNPGPSEFFDLININKRIKNIMKKLLPELVKNWPRKGKRGDIEKLITLIIDLLKNDDIELAQIIINEINSDEHQNMYNTYRTVIRNVLDSKDKNLLKNLFSVFPVDYDHEEIYRIIHDATVFENIKKLEKFIPFILNAAIDLKLSGVIDMITDHYDILKIAMYRSGTRLGINFSITEHPEDFETMFAILDPLINKAKFVSSLDKLTRSWIKTRSDAKQYYSQEIVDDMEDIVIPKIDELFYQ